MRERSFTVFTGPMFSAKSSKMLLLAEKARHAGREVHVFKPVCDERYSSSEVVTHMGWRIEATPVVSGADVETYMLEKAENLSKCLVVVDELFMLPGVSDTLIWLFKQGVDVCVASLDLSYQCKPFEEVAKVLPWATEVVKCTSACSVCGESARYTHRKVADEDEIVVGGADKYEARCAVHHPCLNI